MALSLKNVLKRTKTKPKLKRKRFCPPIIPIIKMDVQKIFQMTGGVGDTSYSKNSSYQKKNSDKVKFIALETVEQVYLSTLPKSLGIADLGCSSGQNALSNIKDIVHEIQGISRKILRPAPEFRVCLNDLPANDFNVVFRALPCFFEDLKKNQRNQEPPPSLYIAAYPGTFYGRIFPDNSLHFIYSSYSLHWLSRVPLGLYDEKGKSINKGSIHISERSPPEVAEAYGKQFQKDFSSFLNSRSEELVSGGGMVLILFGRSGPNYIDRGNSLVWEFLTRSFAILVQKGEVEVEKLDSYDVHLYAPTMGELEDVVRKQGTLKLERLEMFEADEEADEDGTTSYGKRVAMRVRAIQESMISHHFGESIIDDLFEIYARLIDEEMVKEEFNMLSIVLVLRKL